MTRGEEVEHFRSVFRQYGCDETKKLMLVAVIMDKAIDIIEPVKAKIPRPMSIEIRQAYLDKGYCLEWNLPLYRDSSERIVCVDITTHQFKLEQAFLAWRLECKQAYCYVNIIEFCVYAEDADISPDQKKAAKLLKVCIYAMDAGILADNVQQWILSAYAGLDYYSTETGKANRIAQTVKSSKQRTKLEIWVDGELRSITIAEIIGKLALCREFKEYGAPELWLEFFSILDDEEMFNLHPREIPNVDHRKVAYEYDFNGKRKPITYGRFANTVTDYRTEKKSL